MLGGVKNFCVRICDGAPSTAHSSVTYNYKNTFHLSNPILHILDASKRVLCLAISKDADEMLQNNRVCTVCEKHRLKGQKYISHLKIIRPTCDPSTHTMDQPDLVMENFIGMKVVSHLKIKTCDPSLHTMGHPD